MATEAWGLTEQGQGHRARSRALAAHNRETQRSRGMTQCASHKEHADFLVQAVPEAKRPVGRLFQQKMAMARPRAELVTVGQKGSSEYTSWTWQATWTGG